MTSDKTRGVTSIDNPPPPPPPPYDPVTFQGVANYYNPPQSSSHVSIDLSPPPHVAAGNLSPYYNSLGYQSIPDYIVDEARYQPQHPLPCCGLGIGWLLFLLGFFFGAIPWYIGTFMLICINVDNREKPGLIACFIAVIIAVFLITFIITIANQFL
ncbi:60S ribosomal protein L18a-like protein [Impatiens glandulifera]|uniref:60S ribosomal protein L18a-like protein n=1 Tax=Impatiens glandulifera TaxID=253017 RepID=UPI001FB0F57F|nr:60S ribosomal protein L18a-like protein [Impatiens glandulifera]